MNSVTLQKSIVEQAADEERGKVIEYIERFVSEKVFSVAVAESFDVFRGDLRGNRHRESDAPQAVSGKRRVVHEQP